jgi:hypothetical protein
MFVRFIIIVLLSFVAAVPAVAQAIERPLNITLSSSADILITRADGKRIGRDPTRDKQFNDIPGARLVRSPGREPIYVIPPGTADKPLTITIFGRETVTDAKLAITGVRYVFGVNGIVLSKGTVVTVRIAPRGGQLEYSSNRPAAVPRIVLGVDPVEAEKPSYTFEIQRGDLGAGSVLRIVHAEQESFSFGDDAKKPADYELKVTRINADSSEPKYSDAGLRGKRSNHFRVDLAAKSGICLRSDDNPNWLKNAVCRPL